MPVYRPKNLNDDKNVFVTRKTESVCFIKKNYVSHWLFEKVEKEFLMCSKSPWNIHTFNFLNKEKTFSILAENNKAPVVIEMKNCIAVLFEISNKYYNTMTILNNYIKNTIKMIKIQTKEHNCNIEDFYSTKENLENLFHHVKNNSLQRNRSICFNVISKNFNKKNNNASEDEDNENEFKHVGFSANKSRVPAIFKKNMIREKTIQNDPKKNRYKSETDKEFFSMITVREKSMHNDKNKIKPFEFSQTKPVKIFDNIFASEKKDSEICGQDLTQGEIRRMLHPHISTDGMPKREQLWVLFKHSFY